MLAATSSPLTTANHLTIVQDPWWEVIFDCIDHVNHDKMSLLNWDRSATCNTGTYNGMNIIGLSTKSTITSVNLSETYYFPETGFYRVEIRMRRHPDDYGHVTFYDNGVAIPINKDQVSIEAYHQWDHIERIRYPLRWYKQGWHNLTVNITKQAYVESIKIVRIDRYTDSSDGFGHPGTKGVDVDYFDFTQNSVNAINTGKVKMAMQDRFWNDEEDAKLPLQPGFVDSISIILGPDRQNAIPMFGGFCLVPTPKDTELTVDFISSLMNLQRNMVYHNFSIGTVSAADNTQKINYIKMGSVYELIRRLSETQEYSIQTYGVPREYGFYKNFSGPYDFIDTTVTGWIPHRDPNHGMSPPCLKFTLPHSLPPGYTEIPARAILFDDPLNPWNAAEFNQYFNHYYVSGIGSRYPLEFNLEFSMFRAGQDFTDAIPYTVHVTGKDNVTNEIGDFELIRDGTWRELTFDLASMFKTKAPSSEYWITDVSMVGTITQDMIDQRKCSAIWVDNFLSYRTQQQAPQYKGQNNVKDALGEINDVCDKTNHVAYVRPGIERCEDVLVVLPEENQVSSVVIDEADNLISLESWKNDPHGQGFLNQSKVSFNYANGRAGSASAQDDESIDHFGPFEKYDSAGDINNQTDANTLVKNNVMNNKDANKIGFTVRIFGSTLLEIGQLMAANILSNRISRIHKIATITQTMDLSKSTVFESKADMNYPSLEFLDRLEMLNNRRELRDLGLTVINQIYRNYGNMNMGLASPGTYSN